jgi:RNA polymerase sigma-70 factor (ECF subfamily)
VKRQANDGQRLAHALAGGRQGDPEAIHYLYDRYANDVYSYLCTILRDDREAEDITQNVFIKLIRILPKYEERAVPFSAWLFRVARNAALDHFRAQRMIPYGDVRDPRTTGSDEELERHRTLRDALSALSPEQRRVVLWRHLLGLSPVEIAERLGRTEGAIHALHHRGRLAIQAELRSMNCAPSTMARTRELTLTR